MEQQTGRQILIDSLLTRYWWWPVSGNKPVLVFLHGWRSDGSVWFSIIKSFNNYPILVLNLPGFGGTDPPKKDWDLSDYAQFVNQVLVKLDIRKAILVGHSFGGAVAAKLTAIIPDKVPGLVLVDASGIRAKTLRVKLYKTAAKLVSPVFRLPAFASIRNNIYKSLGFEDYIATPYLTVSYRKIIAEDLRPTLAKINCPVLLMWGNKDKDTPITHAYIMKNTLKKAVVQVIPGAGHFVFLDKPEEFNRTLNNFLNTL